MEYRVKTPLKIDATTTVSPGERVELAEATALELLTIDAIEFLGESAPALTPNPPAGLLPVEPIDLAALDLDALIAYVSAHFSPEVADGLSGTEAQVREQVADLIAQAQLTEGD